MTLCVPSVDDDDEEDEASKGVGDDAGETTFALTVLGVSAGEGEGEEECVGSKARPSEFGAAAAGDRML